MGGDGTTRHRGADPGGSGHGHTGPGIPAAQLDEAALHRLRAVSVSHRRAQRLANARLSVSLLLAAAGLAAVLVPALAVPVTVLGGVWAVAHSLGLTTWESGEARRAALLQELFDVQLFRLEWNTALVGTAPAPQEVSGLARRFRNREDNLRDYYEIPELPAPYDVLACQQQNLGWGARVRRRYARTVLTALLVWLGAGLVVGLALRMNVLDLLMLWYVPSLGAVLTGLDVVRTQKDVVAERERVSALLAARVAESGDPAALTTFARQVQDVIFQSRLRHTRVPDWFFRRFKAADRADFQAATNELWRTVRHAAARPG
ncbi:S-4TM family putative pore-forming effector [Streptomyces sp. NPDC056975]|uniref:S-4TM family putative pore-forming effector n=1 Tax=Streptomyces sp. NPDC056975 TaxID=3345985 RepID=UPI003639C006